MATMASSSWVVFASILAAQALCYASGKELPTAPRSVNDYIERNVKFYIFNSDSPAGVKVDLTVDSLVSNGFNKSLSTTVVIHGYGHDITDPLYANVAAALVDVRAPTNVLGVDWGVLCPKPLYLTSRSRVGSVGAVVAKLLQLLVDNGLADAAGLHLIGHSLGAHVAANAAKILKVGRISGLDPALPLFYDWSMDRLKPTDADFVDVIHTSSGKLGYKVPTGHADFYPNGGKVSQPGCEGLFADGLLGSCSHQRAHELYGASIGDPAAFASEKCDSYEQAMAGTCINSGSSGSPAANMGYYVTPSTQGVYYVKTTGTKPFKTN